MDCSLSALDETGEDTSQLDAKVKEFSQLIAAARAKVEEAKEAYDASDKDAVAQSRTLLADARDLAHDAQKKLVEVKNEIMALGGTLCAEAEVAVDESEFEVEEPKEEKNEVEVSGDVGLSEEAQTLLDSLVAAFEGVEGKAELKLKVKKEGNETTVEKEEIEGELTAEQQTLWEDLKAQVVALVEAAEGDDLELEIEIEHEVEAEEAEEEEGQDDDESNEDENETNTTAA